MLKIRPATPEDAFDIATINTLGWKTTYRGLMPDQILDNLAVTEERVEGWKKVIQNAQIYMVAENESGVVGYLSGGKSREANVPYPYELYALYVHPDCQRLGVGCALVKAFRKKIKGEPFCVYALDGNTCALNFYQKIGGIRYPKFDSDSETYGVMMHDLMLGFKGKTHA